MLNNCMINLRPENHFEVLKMIETYCSLELKFGSAFWIRTSIVQTTSADLILIIIAGTILHSRRVYIYWMSTCRAFKSKSAI
jgi:hypothetical protein